MTTDESQLISAQQTTKLDFIVQSAVPMDVEKKVNEKSMEVKEAMDKTEQQSNGAQKVMNSVPRHDDKQDACDSDVTRCYSSDERNVNQVSSTKDTSLHNNFDTTYHEKRKKVLCKVLSEVDRMFSLYKERMYEEKMGMLIAKEKGLQDETSSEYLDPLQRLQANYVEQSQVANRLKEFRIACIKNEAEASRQSSLQQFENQKQMLIERIREEIHEKVRTLMTDRRKLSEEANNMSSSRKRTRSQVSGRGRTKKKPCVVEGPHIVYQISEEEAMEDWTTIVSSLYNPEAELQKAADGDDPSVSDAQ